MKGKMFDLEGKTAIVTGAGRGIGKAIALGLAEAGADVGLISRTLSELEAVAEQDPNFFYIPLVTREAGASDWAGLRGRVQSVIEANAFAALTGFPLDPDECHVYLCGNPGMVDGMESDLGGRGFRKHTPGHAGTLRLEKYW